MPGWRSGDRGQHRLRRGTILGEGLPNAVDPMDGGSTLQGCDGVAVTPTGGDLASTGVMKRVLRAEVPVASQKTGNQQVPTITLSTLSPHKHR